MTRATSASALMTRATSASALMTRATSASLCSLNCSLCTVYSCENNSIYHNRVGGGVVEG